MRKEEQTNLLNAVKNTLENIRCIEADTDISRENCLLLRLIYAHEWKWNKICLNCKLKMMNDDTYTYCGSSASLRQGIK